jgi:outer membrane protein assembly factor BamB
VCTGPSNSLLSALNAATGQQAWSAATGNQIWSSPAVANGIVYIGSDKLYAFGLRPTDPPARHGPATAKPDVKLLPK